MVERLRADRDQIAREVKSGTRPPGELVGANILYRMASYLHREGMYPRDLLEPGVQSVKPIEAAREEVHDKYIPSGAAAKLLGVSTNTLRKWSDEGRIDHITLPKGHRRFSYKELQTFLKNSRDNENPPEFGSSEQHPDEPGDPSGSREPKNPLKPSGVEGAKILVAR